MKRPRESSPSCGAIASEEMSTAPRSFWRGDSRAVGIQPLRRGARPEADGLFEIGGVLRQNDRAVPEEVHRELGFGAVAADQLQNFLDFFEAAAGHEALGEGRPFDIDVRVQDEIHVREHLIKADLDRRVDARFDVSAKSEHAFLGGGEVDLHEGVEPHRAFVDVSLGHKGEVLQARIVEDGGGVEGGIAEEAVDAFFGMDERVKFLPSLPDDGEETVHRRVGFHRNPRPSRGRALAGEFFQRIEPLHN